MKKCNYCGHELNDNNKFCPNCGARCENNSTISVESTYGAYSYNVPPKESEKNDGSSIGFGILSFFIPIVGLILFLVWHDEYPKRAKSCGIGALISVVSNVVIGLCGAIIYFIIIILFIQGLLFTI